MEEESMSIIGIAGTAGAGKDVVAGILHKLYGTENLSTGDVVRAMTRYLYHLPSDSMPVRDQLFPVATFLREIDPAFTVKFSVMQAETLGLKLAVITGLRATGEADAIKDAGGILIGVDAEPRVRYDRIFARGRDSEAEKTFEQFLTQDEHENAGIAQTGELRGVRAIINEADICIMNNGTLEELEAQVREKLGPLFVRATV